jgi:hypothetical protein
VYKTTADNYEDTYMAFWTRTRTSDITEKMRITSEGYVGIGTSSPTGICQIAGTRTNSQGQLLIKGVLDNAYLQIYADTPATYECGLQFVGTSGTVSTPNWGIKMTAASTALKFVYIPSSIEPMTILASGNVGIGTTIPTSLLDVNGTFKCVSLGASSTTGTGTGSNWYFRIGNLLICAGLGVTVSAAIITFPVAFTSAATYSITATLNATDYGNAVIVYTWQVNGTTAYVYTSQGYRAFSYIAIGY